MYVHATDSKAAAATQDAVVALAAQQAAEVAQSFRRDPSKAVLRFDTQLHRILI